MVKAITQSVFSEGYFSANRTTNSNTPQPMALSLTQIVDPSRRYDEYAYVGTGCYRSPEWPWYLQAAPWYASIPCIPLFALLLAFWNGQNWRSVQDKKQLSIMVLLGCISYAANTVGETFIHGTVGNVLGAFAVSLAGSMYERIFHGFAFVVMVPGVLFLVPVGAFLSRLGNILMDIFTFTDRPHSCWRTCPELQQQLHSVCKWAQHWFCYGHC